MLRILFWIWVIFGLVGCSSMSLVKDVRQGMTKEELTQKLGEPDNKVFRDNKEVWSYKLRGDVWGFRFDDGRLTRMQKLYEGESFGQSFARGFGGGMSSVGNGINSPNNSVHCTSYVNTGYVTTDCN